MRKSVEYIITICSLVAIAATLFVFLPKKDSKSLSKTLPQEIVKPTPSIEPTISPTPSPRPLTFAELNAKFGPCARVPTLMYHHVEDYTQAKTEGHGSLTVNTVDFKSQMQDLVKRGFTTISMSDLISFFDQSKSLPAKSILLTFDDGYKDFGTDAYPILRDLNLKATIFTPTGLMNNPDYLSWATLMNIASDRNILFANHTWSHHSVAASKEVVEKEISLADGQLKEKNLNIPKVFAYPYGNPAFGAEKYLSSLNYKLAFTTRSGTTLCKGQRFELPRVRVGNAPLASYGI